MTSQDLGEFVLVEEYKAHNTQHLEDTLAEISDGVISALRLQPKKTIHHVAKGGQALSFVLENLIHAFQKEDWETFETRFKAHKAYEELSKLRSRANRATIRS